MLKGHDRFYSANGKRLVLIVDDEAVNREMLGYILSDSYEILYAADGKEALALIRANHDLLSLVLLDLLMPEMDGFTLLRQLRADETLRRIPVIVLTSEKTAEVESLQLGASDFITKPYELPAVILARVQRTIELAEDTYIIQSTERDELTGLLNREFFYRYAEEFDRHHPEQAMDALSVDISHFHLINELYGRAFGDMVLKKLGGRLLTLIQDLGGIAGRRDADKFLLYCPHGVDCEALHRALSDSVAEEKKVAHIRLRIGVYRDADRSLEMERRFDRAKLAGDAIRDNYTSFVSSYDKSLHDSEFLSERLIDDMDTALAQHQFRVLYQPKYDVTGERPVLRSAEALIRWRHPSLGMVSPGVFIPLFERNGLIQKLDRYVWREAAEQMRIWREQYGVTLPVSVNVSRIDMYAPDFVSYLRGLLEENHVNPGDYFLEITESAYAEDSEQMISRVMELQSLGFCVEMDDFGSGYSSLNMLATLPIDALKLDMAFIRNLRHGEKNARLLELMIDIAKYLNVPVIAEGVESEEQMQTLRQMGCTMIQGYFFSKPVVPEEFNEFIERGLKQC